MDNKIIVLQGGTPSAKPERLRDTYFIGCYMKTGKLRAIKIGVCARGTTVKRLRTLRTGSMDRLEILAVYRGNVERKMFRLFSAQRVRRNGEFFKPSKELLALIDKLRRISADLEKLETEKKAA